MLYIEGERGPVANMSLRSRRRKGMMVISIEKHRRLHFFHSKQRLWSRLWLPGKTERSINRVKIKTETEVSAVKWSVKKACRLNRVSLTVFYLHREREEVKAKKEGAEVEWKGMDVCFVPSSVLSHAL